MKNIETLLSGCPLHPAVTVLQTHPCGLVAVNKPAGIMSHPNRKSGDNEAALIDAPYDEDGEYYQWGEGEDRHRAWLLHRLDSPTSGVILLALDQELAAGVQNLFARRTVRKIYHAVVIGRPPPQPNIWLNRLEKRRQGQGVRMVAGSRLEAKTRFQIRNKDPNGKNLTLIELEPLTGRTHQLRVQCSIRGCPILGDRTYGHFEINRLLGKVLADKRLFLHASSISFQLQYKGAAVKFSAEAKLPDSFNRLMQPSRSLRELQLPAAMRHRSQRTKRYGRWP